MIKVRDLSKSYGERRAVDGIGFDVAHGEIVGLLGPNGAGKTTILRILAGYLMATRGEVWVAGHDMARESLDARRLIGYLPEIVPLYTDMTTRAYLAFAAKLRGLDTKRTNARIEEVVVICHLEDTIDVIVGKLSKGFRQRVGLAQAIVHDPAVLILDEPTVGIDPNQVAQTRTLIRDLGRDRTILLSSHILPEVSAICERVIIIHRGRIVAQDRVESLAGVREGRRRLRLRVQGPADEVTARLRRIDAIGRVTFEAPDHMVEFAPDLEPRGEITRALVEGGWTLLAMEPVETSLEDIFVELTGAGEADP